MPCRVLSQQRRHPFHVSRSSNVKDEGEGRLFGTALVTQVRLMTRSTFTVLEVAADWREPMALQHIM